jgi:D-alanine--poly(phosphoribitol) ligase subunit 2
MEKNNMEELLKILSEVRPDVDFKNNDKLIDDGIIDSFDIIALVGELNEHFDVEIRVEDLLPENFNSAAAMMKLISRLKDEE